MSIHSRNIQSTTVFLPQSEDSNTSGSKFAVDCQALISESTPTTFTWLKEIQGLQIIPTSKSLGMNHKKILQGVLGSKTRVVVKIADSEEDLGVEWSVYESIKSHGSRNLIKYYCFFRCADDIAKYVELCAGPGSSMHVLVMEYVDAKSMKHHDFGTDIRALVSCIHQVICASLELFLRCGFVHGDLHLDNILIKKTSTKELYYREIDKNVETHGFIIKLMDFELSQTQHFSRSFFKDMHEFLRKLVYEYIGKFQDANILNRCVQMMMNNGRDENVMSVLDLLPEINNLKFAGQCGGGGGGDDVGFADAMRKKRKPCLRSRMRASMM